MDFANLVCKVKTPDCEKCIIKNLCKFDGQTKKKALKKKLKANKLALVFFVRENKNFFGRNIKKKTFRRSIFNTFF